MSQLWTKAYAYFKLHVKKQGMVSSHSLHFFDKEDLMSWVSINDDMCNHCGICVEGCPRCFRRNGDEIAVEANEKCCALCGHCVALCPSGAIVHHKMDMNNFKNISKSEIIKTDDCIQFIRERRSHRHFTKDKIPKKDLEKLIDTVRYAPTGHNDQSVEIILMQDPVRIKRLSNLTLDHMASVRAKSAKKLEELKSGDKGTSEEIFQLEEMLRFIEMLMQRRSAGYDPIFYEVPAVAIFHSTVQTVTAKDNCVIASTTMGLLARTMGLETTYIALFEHAARAYPPIRDELRLPEGNQVFSVLVIGYPKFKYFRTVDRRPIRTRWE
jgi:nitroreductase/NAD-dependent dihydropyrimidine dehydrogenase PreA subunit